jgi:hypothetical protein
MRMMWLRKGNIANAMCWGITPLSLEHEGRSSIFYCARSFGIIGGRVGLSLIAWLLGGGERQLGESVENGRDTVYKRDATEQKN